ncbi:hypothetical protein [Streptomyces mirabilis]|uniref:hypothetical protein n=1 Tax=Streptomyces mirabilis TaxID=68239 RepID=UPI0036765213
MARSDLCTAFGLQSGDAPDRFLVAGLPELLVAGLAASDSRKLLASVVPGPLDKRVRDRIVAETRGNPLALLELSRGWSLRKWLAGFGPLDARPASDHRTSRGTAAGIRRSS